MERLLTFFDIDFRDPELLRTALTHSSYANEHDVSSNERLEFLGDAVLDVVVSEYLYGLDNELREGGLTKLRARYVCETALAEYAKACDLGTSLRLGHGEEKSGGRQRSALLADAFEALVGAAYLDGGLDKVEHIAAKVVFPLIEKDEGDGFIDFKSHLQELVQSDRRELDYRIVSEEGPSHKKRFTIRVYMDEILMGEGEGRNKKQAEQNAAAAALEKLAGKKKKDGSEST